MGAIVATYTLVFQRAGWSSSVQAGHAATYLGTWSFALVIGMRLVGCQVAPMIAASWRPVSSAAACEIEVQLSGFSAGELISRPGTQ